MSDRIQRRVLHDRSVLIDIDCRLAPALEGWLPPDDRDPETDAPPDVRIYAHLAPPLGVESPSHAPVLRWRSIALWHRAGHGSCVMAAAERDVAGSLDLDQRQATVVTGGSEAATPRLWAALTLASGILIGRTGRALVQAAALLSPSGGAWLLVGADGSGAVTAAVRLGTAGWRCLGTHAAVLREVVAERRVEVEGWSCGGAGKALPVTAGVFPLSGALVLRAEPEHPTRLVDAPAMDLLALLGPTSPWVWLDAPAARGTTRALHGGLSVHVRELRLGLDSYADPGRLAEVLTPLC